MDGPGTDRGVVFQSATLLPWLTVRDNVRLALEQVRRGAGPGAPTPISSAVGLAGQGRALPRELSAGMQQRVGIARAFALEPRLLLLDEPFSLLDALTRMELQDELMTLWEGTRRTVIMVTHDVDEALLLADRIVMMTSGPAATVGEILEVPFPRPRQREDILANTDYFWLRDCESLGLPRGARAHALSGSGRTLCPYCGVGCGLLVGDRSGGGGQDQGRPRASRELRGRLRQGGAPAARSSAPKTRLLHPHAPDPSRPAARARAVAARPPAPPPTASARSSREHGPDAVAVYASGQLLTEEYYLAAKLAKGFLGTNNFDTNSRLCMASAAVGYARSLGADGPPAAYADIESADCFFLIGTNTADCHPITYKRIRRRKLAAPDGGERDRGRPALDGDGGHRRPPPAAPARLGRGPPQRDAARALAPRAARPGLHGRAHRRLGRAAGGRSRRWPPERAAEP